MMIKAFAVETVSAMGLATTTMDCFFQLQRLSLVVGNR